MVEENCWGKIKPYGSNELMYLRTYGGILDSALLKIAMETIMMSMILNESLWLKKLLIQVFESWVLER